MAYQTGSATGPSQLLDALRVFAVANGWKELRWGASGTGQQLSLQKADQFVHLRSAVEEALRPGYEGVTGIFLVGADGFDAAQPWNNQPGTIRSPNNQLEGCGLYEAVGPCTYHLFSVENPTLLTMVAEVAPGVYHHLAFGQLTKHGSYPGGAFVSGAFGPSDSIYTNTNDFVFAYRQDHHCGLPFNDFKSFGGSFVRAKVDGFDGWFSVCHNHPLTGKRAKSTWEDGTGGPRESLARYWWAHAPNTLNGAAPMQPFYVFVERPDGFFSPFGYTPHLRYLNIQHYTAAEPFAIGREEWMAFPGHSKNGKSGVHGYAVRLVR
ncbi:hypothetical protein OOT46_02370 [Aquabacterium sp. A7-Y]|uniref:hypothetical protein n=1 Tax=Aquabacterium sp. A7-Y TaxID=1349605 RepID=UPI00223E2F5C|nr:hypothetical protein [Aquabacterium sp. A7-Y]MCW7536699.1 hypothetical protein [Aquabacterium sp. A7-Y]